MMKSRGVDEGELGVVAVHDAEQRVARGLWPRRDDRERLLQGRVQKRRFPDVGSPDDGDGRKAHAGDAGGTSRLRRAPW